MKRREGEVSEHFLRWLWDRVESLDAPISRATLMDDYASSTGVRATGGPVLRPDAELDEFVAKLDHRLAFERQPPLLSLLSTTLLSLLSTTLLGAGARGRYAHDDERFADAAPNTRACGLALSRYTSSDDLVSEWPLARRDARERCPDWRRRLELCVRWAYRLPVAQPELGTTNPAQVEALRRGYEVLATLRPGRQSELSVGWRDCCWTYDECEEHPTDAASWDATRLQRAIEDGAVAGVFAYEAGDAGYERGVEAQRERLELLGYEVGPYEEWG